jgi:virginiamycin B lyase
VNRNAIDAGSLVALGLLAVTFLAAQTSVQELAQPAPDLAQPVPEVTQKAGVQNPGVQHAMAELVPLATFALEGRPDWMAATSDAVWVTSSNLNHVVRLDAKSNHPGIIVPVAEPCAGLAVAFGSLWIPSCGEHAVIRVNAETGAPQAKILAAPADSEGGIASGAGSIWIVTSKQNELARNESELTRNESELARDGSQLARNGSQLARNGSELTRIDPATNAVIAHIRLPAGSFNPIFAEGSIWVSSNTSGTLVRVDPDLNKIVSETAVGPMPRFLTLGAGSIWVLNQGDGTIARVDASTGKRTALIVAGVPGHGGEVAFGAGAVWISVIGYPITRIDPDTNTVTGQWHGEGGDSIRVAHGSIWLTDLTGARVWRLAIPTR